jgi:hypothetical protein
MLQSGPATSPPKSPARPSTSPGRIVIQAWLASRGSIAVVALLLALAEHRSLTDMVSNWDVQHFTRLAVGGYLAEPDGILMAFFPGLPTLLALLLQFGIPVAVGGVILSLACSAVAAAALLRLGGPWAAVAWLFAPTAVFTTVPYTESLFCAAAFWGWERARAGRWLPAVALAAVACTVRVSGVFLIGALLVMIITSRAPSRVKLRRIGLMSLPVAVVVAFAAFLHGLTGSWTAWYHAQSTGWVRQLTWPWQSFLNTIPAVVPGAYADHPWWAAVFRGEMVSMAVGLAAVGWCIVRSVRARRTGETTLWGEASWVGVQVLAFSLSYWFFSVNRATLLWFPLWIMLGRWVEGRPGKDGPGRPARRLVRPMLISLAFAVEIVLMLWWSWLFFTGHWAS